MREICTSGSPFRERRGVGGDRLLQPRRAALAFPEPPERVAEVVLTGTDFVGRGRQT